jgi:hypothetical protein
MEKVDFEAEEAAAAMAGVRTCPVCGCMGDPPFKESNIEFNGWHRECWKLWEDAVSGRVPIEQVIELSDRMTFLARRSLAQFHARRNGKA